MPILNETVLFNRKNHGDGLAEALKMKPQDIVMDIRESGLKGQGRSRIPHGN